MLWAARGARSCALDHRASWTIRVSRAPERVRRLISTDDDVGRRHLDVPVGGASARCRLVVAAVLVDDPDERSWEATPASGARDRRRQVTPAGSTGVWCL